ncbi:MAG: PadR family transcriptional regulator [Anaerofustis sp.]
MFDRSQLMRGTLEGCILKLIGTEPTYGYELMMRLRNHGFSDISEGTLYPLLVRLENKELLGSEFRPSPLGPKRKYYTLTEEGRDYLRDFEESWAFVKTSVDAVLHHGEE